MSAWTAKYKKDDVILLSGDSVSFVALILSGGVKIIKEDIDGNASILAEFSVSEIFAETLACAGISQSPVTVRASADAEILFVDYRRIIQPCTSACAFHSKLIENMLYLLAKKNLMLNEKIEILSKRTTREKLICFFDHQRGAATKFEIPFNREELANYLCVDRSAMSNVLCAMRDDGTLKFNRNRFEIVKHW